VSDELIIGAIPPLAEQTDSPDPSARRGKAKRAPAASDEQAADDEPAHEVDTTV
jgi:hypothetical protein